MYRRQLGVVRYNGSTAKTTVPVHTASLVVRLVAGIYRHPARMAIDYSLRQTTKASPRPAVSVSADFAARHPVELPADVEQVRKKVAVGRTPTATLGERMAVTAARHWGSIDTPPLDDLGSDVRRCP